MPVALPLSSFWVRGGGLGFFGFFKLLIIPQGYYLGSSSVPLRGLGFMVLGIIGCGWRFRVQTSQDPQQLWVRGPRDSKKIGVSSLVDT